MNKTLLILFFLLMCVGYNQAQTFTLKSNSIGGQATDDEVFNGFGCNGKNMSPELHWENIPTGTKSFAITMYDPDAPTGSGFWHWVAFNIPFATTSVPAGAGDVVKKLLPEPTVQSITDFGKPGYGGPCPPVGHGFHQYIITVYALDVDKLDLDKSAMPAYVGFNLTAHTIQKASLIMYYKR